MEKNIERIKYKCNKCNFEFTRKKNAEIRLCPYCGIENTLQKMGDFADKILRESDFVSDF